MFATVFAIAAIFASVVVAAPSGPSAAGASGSGAGGSGGGGGGGSSSSTTSTTNIANVPQVNECNHTGGMVCCNSLDFDQGSVQESLLSVFDIPMDFNLLVGHGCSPLVGLSNQCNAQAACCEKTYSGIGVNCNSLLLL